MHSRSSGGPFCDWGSVIGASSRRRNHLGSSDVDPFESAPESASETTGLSEAISVMATTKAEVATPAVAPEATGVTSEAPPAINQVAKLMGLRTALSSKLFHSSDPTTTTKKSAKKET